MSPALQMMPHMPDVSPTLALLPNMGSTVELAQVRFGDCVCVWGGCSCGCL